MRKRTRCFIRGRFLYFGGSFRTSEKVSPSRWNLAIRYSGYSSGSVVSAILITSPYLLLARSIFSLSFRETFIFRSFFASFDPG